MYCTGMKWSTGLEVFSILLCVAFHWVDQTIIHLTLDNTSFIRNFSTWFYHPRDSNPAKENLDNQHKKRNLVSSSIINSLCYHFANHCVKRLYVDEPLRAPFPIQRYPLQCIQAKEFSFFRGRQTLGCTVTLKTASPLPPQLRQKDLHQQASHH